MSTLKLELTNLSGAIDSLEKAIKTQSKDDFVKSYNTLTTSCNSCHQKAGLDFYTIIAPKTPAYSTDIE